MKSPIPIAWSGGKDSAVPGQCACPRCGASFTCGLATGESRCWCFDLPNLIPLSTIGPEGCLCPVCLRAAIEAHQKGIEYGQRTL
jgi:hypothetical protein